MARGDGVIVVVARHGHADVVEVDGDVGRHGASACAAVTSARESSGHRADVIFIHT